MPGREVSIAFEGKPMPAYAAWPDDTERGVVVIHELHGRMPEIDRVVDRFAAAGFAAVEPDMFAGCIKPVCIQRAVATTYTGEGDFARRLEGAKAWLAREAGLDEARVGVIGFCLGGGLALAVGPKFAAVSTNYGEVPPERVLRGSPPIIACFGGRDRVFARNAKRLPERLRKLGAPEPEVHVYPTVGHSFLTDGEHPLANAASRPLFHIRYDPRVAEDAWAKILDFFDRTL